MAEFSRILLFLALGRGCGRGMTDGGLILCVKVVRGADEVMAKREFDLKASVAMSGATCLSCDWRCPAGRCRAGLVGSWRLPTRVVIAVDE